MPTDNDSNQWMCMFRKSSPRWWLFGGFIRDDAFHSPNNLAACYWICGFLLGNRSQKKWLKFCSFFSQIWFFTKEKRIGAKQQWKLYLRPMYFSPCIMRKQSEFPPTKFASEYVWMYCLIGMTSNTKRWYFFFNVTVVIS